MSTHPSTPKFPDWFPADCPTLTATDALGAFFRFVTRNPVDALDFLSHHELDLARGANACQRCSLSIYRTLDGARRRLVQLRDRNRARFGPHIAEATLNSEHGKIKQEGRDPEHYEWWAYEGIVRHEPFRVVETVED